MKASRMLSDQSHRSQILFCVWIGVCGCLLLPHAPVSAETVVLSGAMHAETQVELKQTFDTSPGTEAIRLTLPKALGVLSPSTTQAIRQYETIFSVPPTTRASKRDESGNEVEEVVWEQPRGTIVVTSRFVSRNNVRLRTWESAAAYPLQSIPLHVRRYLEPTDFVQKDEPGIAEKARELARGSRTQREAVSRILNFVVDHLTYKLEPDRHDALFAMERREANCTGYSHVSMALLRAAGIPTRGVIGLTIGKSWPVSMKTGSLVMNSGRGPHAWIEVWFPDLGWLPFDAQSTHLFVSAYHIRHLVGRDLIETNKWFSYAGVMPIVDVQFSSNLLDEGLSLQATDTHPDPRRYILAGDVRIASTMSGLPSGLQPAPVQPPALPPKSEPAPAFPSAPGPPEAQPPPAPPAEPPSAIPPIAAIPPQPEPSPDPAPIPAATEPPGVRLPERVPTAEPPSDAPSMAPADTEEPEPAALAATPPATPPPVTTVSPAPERETEPPVPPLAPLPPDREKAPEASPPPFQLPPTGGAPPSPPIDSSAAPSLPTRTEPDEAAPSEPAGPPPLPVHDAEPPVLPAAPPSSPLAEPPAQSPPAETASALPPPVPPPVGAVPTPSLPPKPDAADSAAMGPTPTPVPETSPSMRQPAGQPPTPATPPSVPALAPPMASPPPILPPTPSPLLLPPPIPAAVPPLPGRAELTDAVEFGNLEFPAALKIFAPLATTRPGQPREVRWALVTETAEYATGPTEFAQAFRVSQPMALVDVSLALQKFGGVAGEIWLELRTDSGRWPGPTVLAESKRIPVAGLVPFRGYRWIVFDFQQANGGPILPQGRYWAVLRHSGDGILNWYFSPGTAYGEPDDSRARQRGGAAWDSILTYRFNFRVSGLVKP